MTTMPRIVGIALVALGLTLGPHSTVSAAMDGSTPLICAVTTVMECDGSGQCERQNPARHPDFPALLRINVPARTITLGTVDAKKSEIKSVTRLDGRLILHGGENGRGWAATIGEDSGLMAAGIVAEDLTFSLFGTCTTP
jgi:hypothetical protein